MSTQTPLGPTTVPGDSPFARRLRFHQAWFRARVLGIADWGSTPAGRPVGSILSPESASAHLNFTSTAAFDAYALRRSQGWGVDPTRTLAHMTSSQTLMFNVFGPLVARNEWLGDVLTRVLERAHPLTVERVEFEYSPRPLKSYLNDRTLLDVAMWATSAVGPELIVCEVKFTDRFSTRAVRFDLNPRYDDLVVSDGPWTSPLSSLTTRGLNQLTRVHALGSKIAAVDDRRISLVVLHHPTDLGAPLAVTRYREHLRSPDDVSALSLSELLRAADRGSVECHHVEALRTRYLNLALSDDAFTTSRVRRGEGR